MKKLLIVIDYQNDFVTGSLGSQQALALEQPIAEKIRYCRKNGYDIAFTLDTHDDNYLSTVEGKALPVPHCRRESEGWSLYGEVRRLKDESDKCFHKSTFGSDELYEYLKGSEYEKIELVGVVSDICVISNAVLAKTALPEAEITLDSSCTAGSTEELKQKAIDVMKSLQIKII